MQTVNGFLSALGSGAPTPGGGGASALMGAVGAALCSMVANLTDGKKKYAAYQEDITRILSETALLEAKFEGLMAADEEVFYPLSQAYGIPKDDPTREEIMAKALRAATEVPLEMMRTVAEVTPILEELQTKGSKLAVSDVAVAAAACRAAMEGASMNVWINTRSMQDAALAASYNSEAEALLATHIPRLATVFEKVTKELKG